MPLRGLVIEYDRLLFRNYAGRMYAGWHLMAAVQMDAKITQKESKMISDEVGKQLHDKATRGESLSPEERTQLENWYALQDDAESKELGLSATEKTLTTLQGQVDAALAQLVVVTKRIQEIAVENETLRREVASLRRQLARVSTEQAV